MNLAEMVLSAWDALRANKLRSVLTMLGIWIGVASIIAIFAIGQGGQSAVVSVIESQRLQRTIQILPREWIEPGLPQPGQVLSISDADLALARSFSGVASVGYTLYGQGPVSAVGHTVNASIQAGPADLDELARFMVVQGRMFTATDVVAHRPVALVSQSLAKKLFGAASPVGRTVQVGGHPVHVIGETVSTQLGILSTLLGADEIYMPATTCRDFFPWWSITEMDVEVAPGVDKADLSRRLVTALNVRAGNPDAFVDSSGLWTGIEHMVDTVTRILTWIIGAVAGIALLVGGVGVMNIMLVSVAERTQEIGIRASIGARPRDILAQFLVEAVVITSLGGVAGIGTGIGVAAAVRAITGLPVGVGWPVVIGSFAFSAWIGLICGLYPAMKAARMNPIDALRYE
ncbi:MAG: ABC transporter permease [Thermoflavifilum sp.]|nr:ABC transporter permease [Thermoflavifilum sp.]MCL6514974.1 ABC transporter permease [Alicyclobacillus sp.]